MDEPNAMDAQLSSVWEADVQLVTTRLTGDVRVEDIARWEAGLQAALAHVATNSGFKLLVDQTGYELRDMAAHKAMRVVIPQLLAAYGMRAAVLDLFPEVEIAVTRTRNIVCLACATVHHDQDKMAEYERGLGRPNQRFFTHAPEARAWLLALEQLMFNV